MEEGSGMLITCVNLAGSGDILLGKRVLD